MNDNSPCPEYSDQEILESIKTELDILAVRRASRMPITCRDEFEAVAVSYKLYQSALSLVDAIGGKE